MRCIGQIRRIVIGVLLVAVASVRAEYFSNVPHYSWHEKPTIEGHTWVDQLNTGKKLGVIAASDDYYYVRLTMESNPCGEEFMRERIEFAWSTPVWIEGHAHHA